MQQATSFATTSFSATSSATRLLPRRIGIDTHSEPVVYMRSDCPVCRSEGFEAQSRIEVQIDNHNGAARRIIATLNIVYGDLLAEGELGFSESAWRRLQPEAGAHVRLGHTRALDSMSEVRSKLYGNRLSQQSMQNIVADIVAGHYGDIHLAAFVTACAGNRLDTEEIIWLTEAMVNAGERLQWSAITSVGKQAPDKPVLERLILDKHCLGGIPGNRTTPIVVAIVAANGLMIPKTSSRGITSPAGTADTMETMTRVALNMAEMHAVVQQEGGCFVWGGSVSLSPADDILIRVERALDIDSEGQMVASVLSKKIAAGSTHVLIDIPVGATAKVRSTHAAQQLSHQMIKVGEALGLQVQTVISDGMQPVGNGIGPALEARDVLAVLRGVADAPEDLRERALLLAGALLEMGGACAPGSGHALAQQTLLSGRALDKFIRICKAQGGFHEPQLAHYQHVVRSERNGIVSAINNRLLARLGKLAGAPAAKGAGLYLSVHLGDRISRGQQLFTLYAETAGELAYALDFYQAHGDMIHVEDEST